MQSPPFKKNGITSGFRAPLARPAVSEIPDLPNGMKRDMAYYTMSADDAALCGHIALRAQEIGEKVLQGANLVDVAQYTMILAICHKHVAPLKLLQLLMSDNADFVHDVFGIVRHWDCNIDNFHTPFTPKFAVVTP